MKRTCTIIGVATYRAASNGISPFLYFDTFAPEDRRSATRPLGKVQSATEEGCLAILLYPDCNYLSWSGAVDCRRTLLNLKIFCIPGGLLDQRDTFSPYSGDLDPRRSQP
jgi:hypothetical protein